MADRAMGNRVVELRRRRGMTQEELAETAGLHVNVIKKIENGGTARMESYHAIARALGVVTMTFVLPSTVAPEPADARDDRDIVLADLRGVIVPPIGLSGPIYRDHLDEGEPNLDRLNRAAHALFSAYHADRYDDVAQLAPALIRSAHFHVDAVPESQRRDAVRLRGDLLGVTGRYLIQVRAHDLALIALRDAIRDASEAGDQVLAVSAIGSQAWIMLRQARFADVEQVCAAIADDIEPRLSSATPNELAAWAWMLMRASAAAARNNRPEEAREYLSTAAAAAARIGVQHEDLDGHINFGPLTVAVKGPENELIAGHPDRALELSEQLPRGVGKVNPSGWNRHLLDRARAQLQIGQVDEATLTLTGLRQQSGNWMRHQRLARDIVRDLLKARKRMPSDQQRALADFLGLEV